MAPTRAQWPDGRWHFQHGPIDLILSADGRQDAIDRALASAWCDFQEMLAELVDELELLRRPFSARSGRRRLAGPVARRMAAAVAPYAREFITPMAAVAGAVADQLITSFHRPGIVRAAINNGGDIAIHLTEDSHFEIALMQLPGVRADAAARITVHACNEVRGVATSGWRGRSFSLGVADSVTVLARSAAAADAAATMIANQVDLEHPDVIRRPADEIKDDTDLGSLLVTCAVPLLTSLERRSALARGARYAQALVDSRRISGALLVLQGDAEALGAVSAEWPAVLLAKAA
jgi:ApbE superfamily uncharacterized protein (UPF0280 family)